MRKAVLFIAMSLDGYIADRDGNVNWLGGEEPGRDDMKTYSRFIEGVDTIIMGWNTYRQITTELSPNEWVYAGMATYVVTHKDMQSTKEIQFTDKSPCELVQELKQQDGKDIWVCGGPGIVRQLARKDMIDQYYINVIPTILGDGIRLFEPIEKEIKLKLVETVSYNGITDLIYERRGGIGGHYHES